MRAAQEEAKKKKAEADEKEAQARLARETEKVNSITTAVSTSSHLLVVQVEAPASFSYSNNYTPGQCTYGVASRVSVPSSMGNATNWEAGLRAAGWEYNLRVGAVGVSHTGFYGHVVYVEAINGNQVTIWEMNGLYGPGTTDTRVVDASEYIWLSN